MSILLETVSFGLGGSAGLMLFLIKSKLKIKHDKHGALPWLWNKREAKFICLKCWDRHEHQMKICDCLSYHKEHFHFECPACKYQSLMRTADDN